MTNICIVLDAEGKTLAPTSINKGWILVRKQKACIVRRSPMTIQLKRTVDKTPNSDLSGGIAKKIFVFLLVLFIISFSFISVQAAQSGSSTFSVTPYIPENQIGTSNQIFDLQISPNKSQKLILEVMNETTEEIEVRISAFAATTVSNGEIIYSEHGTPDSSLLYSFESLVTPSEKTVNIPALTVVEVEMTLKSPPKSYDGIILGGFYVVNTADSNADGGSSVFSKTIITRLTEMQSQIKKEPDFHMTSPSLIAGDRSTTFFAEIRNPQPELYNQTAISTALVAADQSVVFLDERSVDFAPNSVYPMTVSEGIRLDPGEYTVQVTAKSGDKEVLFEETYTVDGVDAEPKLEETKAAIERPDQRRSAASGPQDIIAETLAVIPLSLRRIQLILLFFFIRNIFILVLSESIRGAFEQCVKTKERK